MIGKIISQIGKCIFLEILLCEILKEWTWNRLVDRDMVMRYHWGAGVGHLYMHSDQGSKLTGSQRDSQPLAGPGTVGGGESGVDGSGVEGAPNFPRYSVDDGPKAPDDGDAAEGGMEGAPDPSHGQEFEEHDSQQEPPDDDPDQSVGSDNEDLASESGAISDEGLDSEEEDMDEMYGLGGDPDSGGVFSYN